MPDGANIETMDSFTSGTLPLTLIQNGLQINEKLRVNSLLRKDEWEALDTALRRVARGRLNAVADLDNAGLVRNLGGLGVLVDQFESSSDMSEADISLGGDVPGEEDAVDFKLASVPIPITHKDFRLNIRHLEASRRIGQPLDTTGIEVATRKVRDGLEDLVLNGSTAINVNGNDIKGYRTAPDRVTGTLTAAWTDSANRDIIADVIAMIADAESVNHFGPYNLYVSTAYFAELRDDYSANKGDRTFLERLQAIPEINAVKPADRLPNADDVLLVQMSRDNVDLSIGQRIAVVEWSTMGGMVSKFRVMAAMAPRIKPDYAGNLGVVHYTT